MCYLTKTFLFWFLKTFAQILLLHFSAVYGFGLPWNGPPKRGGKALRFRVQEPHPNFKRDEKTVEEWRSKDSGGNKRGTLEDAERNIFLDDRIIS